MKKDKLLERYYKDLAPVMYRYIYYKVGDKELAEDLTADLFIKLYDNPEIMIKRDKEGVKAWLYRVAYNSVVDNSRRLKNKNKQVLQNEHFEIVNSEDSGLLESEIKDEEQKLVFALMAILDPEDKELLMLRYGEEMKFSQIADIYKVEESTIKMRVYRTIEKLKEHLGERV